MSLSSVFQIAQNSLSGMTRRTAVLSRNINDASNPDYARRDLQTITSTIGSQTLSVRRAADAALERATLAALTNDAGQTLLSQRLGILLPSMTLRVKVNVLKLHLYRHDF